MSDSIIIAPNGGGDANYDWKSGGPGAEIKALLKKGNAEIVTLPGVFPFKGQPDWLYVGSNTMLHGQKPISFPANLKQTIDPDPALMTVFTSPSDLPETTEAHTPDIAVLRVQDAKNVQLMDIAMRGYVGMEFIRAEAITAREIVLSNWQNDHYCNMGYSRTGAFWINESCHNLLAENVCVDRAHHHGVLLHYGSTNLAKIITDVMLSKLRVFDCGSGMLRGDDAANIADSILRSPERKGHGYRAWACNIDLQENAHIARVTLRDSYSGGKKGPWKSCVYQEPSYPANPTTCRGLLILNVEAENAGWRGGNELGKPMFVKEGEQSNFFIHAGTLKNCISRNARKAGLYSMYERYESPKELLTVDGFIDEGSPYGVVLEMGAAANVTYRNLKLIDNLYRALHLMGSNITVESSEIYCLPTQKLEPVYLGGMRKLINDESRDPKNQTSIGRYLAYTWGMPGLRINAKVFGLAASVAGYKIHKGSTVPTGALSLPLLPRTDDGNPTVPEIPEQPEEPEIPMPIPLSGHVKRICVEYIDGTRDVITV